MVGGCSSRYTKAVTPHANASCANVRAEMTSGPSCLLLLGTSHVGKSTCARGIGNAIGWPVIATDKLGRHPGRPWTSVPDPVTEFYLRLTDDAIHWFLRVHHENMRPVIQETIKAAREVAAASY